MSFTTTTSCQRQQLVGFSTDDTSWRWEGNRTPPASTTKSTTNSTKNLNYQKNQKNLSTIENLKTIETSFLLPSDCETHLQLCTYTWMHNPIFISAATEHKRIDSSITKLQESWIIPTTSLQFTSNLRTHTHVTNYNWRIYIPATIMDDWTHQLVSSCPRLSGNSHLYRIVQWNFSSTTFQTWILHKRTSQHLKLWLITSFHCRSFTPSFYNPSNTWLESLVTQQHFSITICYHSIFPPWFEFIQLPPTTIGKRNIRSKTTTSDGTTIIFLATKSTNLYDNAWYYTKTWNLTVGCLPLSQSIPPLVLFWLYNELLQWINFRLLRPPTSG